ncbi:MAG TPA: phosphoribosylanthranilate isomerase [Kiloniellales bacterium]
MAIEAKICGINSPAAVEAAVKGGADLIGLNFYPPSPRAVTLEQAAQLAGRVPPGVTRVGLFVDPDDDQLAATLAKVPLDLLQLHGAETPRRVAEIRARFGRPVMKVIKLASKEDLEAATPYLGLVDRLMFDAKTPKSAKTALPGGNAVAFDWQLLAGRRWPRPWLLAGGLTAKNLAEAVGTTGARGVDVSSGVEDAPGRKSPAKIAAFLAAAKAL